VLSAADDLAGCVRADGPLRFDRFLDLALYGPHGFYTAAVEGGRAGRRGGDFLTSPEVGPLFGAVLHRWIEAERLRQGDPVDFTVVEVGAGPGTLARSIRAAERRTAEHRVDRPTAAGGWSTRYLAVEVSPAQRAAHPEAVESLAELPDPPVTGVVIANELLDNLPFRLLVFDGGWREAHVDVDRDGRAVEVLAPGPVEPPPWLPRSAPHGARVPWQQRAADWVDGARALVPGGAVLCIDYTTATTAELAGEPWRAWLRTYRGHDRGAHYLRDLGLQDITAQVAVDQLPADVVVRSQAQFLQRWGIDELVEEGRRAWEAAAAAPTVAALAMRSRVSEAEALLDPTGLGGFSVLEW
jgi:SAM-dependent MidA family methyltransferase